MACGRRVQLTASAGMLFDRFVRQCTVVAESLAAIDWYVFSGYPSFAETHPGEVLTESEVSLVS